MPAEYRVTIRLTPSLYTQLEARGRHGQPMAAIVREALTTYLLRQPDTETTAERLAAMAATIEGLHGQLQEFTTRVECLAAERLPEAASTLMENTAAANGGHMAANTTPTGADITTTLVMLQAQVAALLIRVELLEQGDPRGEAMPHEEEAPPAASHQPIGAPPPELLDDLLAPPATGIGLAADRHADMVLTSADNGADSLST